MTLFDFQKSSRTFFLSKLFFFSIYIFRCAMNIDYSTLSLTPVCRVCWYMWVCVRACLCLGILFKPYFPFRYHRLHFFSFSLFIPVTVSFSLLRHSSSRIRFAHACAYAVGMRPCICIFMCATVQMWMCVKMCIESVMNTNGIAIFLKANGKIHQKKAPHLLTISIVFASQNSREGERCFPSEKYKSSTHIYVHSISLAHDGIHDV